MIISLTNHPEKMPAKTAVMNIHNPAIQKITKLFIKDETINTIKITGVHLETLQAGNIHNPTAQKNIKDLIFSAFRFVSVMILKMFRNNQRNTLSSDRFILRIPAYIFLLCPRSEVPYGLPTVCFVSG